MIEFDPSYAAKKLENEVWTQKASTWSKRLYEIEWSDEKKCRRCDKEKVTVKHRSYY